ncbi:ABC transporter substrate-binding protein [Sideroxydans sp. CL21]|uniref:MlaC/ttg2D family ABC transporter substrate-binding protein n=1 Tax=Sideroxydans sp. CL21 TaxID=2600596 RepID=UPI0012AA4014|nr:ABC transporter substrate-binding protein [Sideroxydans sp. CL21]VVC84959.1 Phospholipid ABC transporter shuttle protein MlaC [Sideroxydans sp. CL21]
MKNIFLLFSGAMLLCQSFVVRADMPDPDVLIKNTVHEVLDVVRGDKELRSGNQKKLLELVDAKVLPHFNFEHMTKLAVGKSWRTATPEQKKALMSEFRVLLVRTYTKAFTSYRDQVVEIKPFKMDPAATDVTVKTAIVKPGSSQQPVLVDYDMEKMPDGWKVYDLTVEGVSLVTSYRGTFADQIQQVGIDGLIKTLTDKNNSAATNAAVAEKADSK